MNRMKIVFFVLIGSISGSGYAEIVTESWLRQAGISCGGGLSVEMQGEIDAAVLKRLKIGSAKAEGSYQLSEAESLLNQFKSEEKRATYVNYITCLTTLMNMASSASTLPPRDIVLSSPIAIATLETVKRGQRFVLTPGDTIAINDHSIIFSVDKIKGRLVYFTWSNSESGKQSSTYASQSKLITIQENCTLVPYKIEEEDNQVSFLANC